PLDRRLDVLVALEENEAREAIALGEPLDQPLTMLPCATRQIARHADIERAVRLVGHDVDPTSSHESPALSRSLVEQAWCRLQLEQDHIPGVRQANSWMVGLRRP